MTKARTNASATPAVGRNMVINGSMNTSQRSVSAAGLGANASTFVLDRFALNFGGSTAGRVTMTQTADGPDGISNNCLKLQCTTADASIAVAESMTLFTILEDINCMRTGHGTAGAQQISVSFYVKGNANATYVVQLLNNKHSGFIHNNRLFSVTTDWTRVEVTFQADTTGDSEFGVTNTAAFSIGWILHAGSNLTSAALASNWATGATNRAAGGDSFLDATSRTLFITGVQMEVGPVATEFEQEDIGVTLRKCQRYLCKVEKGITGTATGATAIVFTYPYPVTMRAQPAIAQSVNAVRVGDMVDTGTQLTSTSTAASSHRGLDSGVFTVSGTADNDLTARRTVLLEPDGSDATFVFDAEL